MNKYCVAYINFFDNDLKQELVEAPNQLEALEKSTLTRDFMTSIEDLGLIKIEDICQEAFNQDSQVAVIEIK